MLNGVASNTSLLYWGPAYCACLPAKPRWVEMLWLLSNCFFSASTKLVRWNMKSNEIVKHIFCSICSYGNGICEHNAFFLPVLLGMSRFAINARILWPLFKEWLQVCVDGSPPFSIQRRVGQRGEITRTAKFFRECHAEMETVFHIFQMRALAFATNAGSHSRCRRLDEMCEISGRIGFHGVVRSLWTERKKKTPHRRIHRELPSVPTISSVTHFTSLRERTSSIRFSELAFCVATWFGIKHNMTAELHNVKLGTWPGKLKRLYAMCPV